MTVLVAVDETERSKRAIETAYDLATSYDDSLVVLHVIPQEEFEAHQNAITDIPGFAEYSLPQQESGAREFARRFATETLGADSTDRIQPRGRVGDISTEILDEVTSSNPRYLVIAGRRRSPTRKALFGDTAQTILLNADCPVVTCMADSVGSE